MNKAKLSKTLKNVQTRLSKHSPEILTGLGIAGMLSTTVLAVRATPKALKMVDEKKKELDTDSLTPLETVKAAWKPYIPAVVTGTVATACLIGANSVNAKRNAALATAYTLSETALSEYKAKVIETVGEKKEKVIREKVNQERIDKNPASKNSVIVVGDNGTLCYDHHSGRYFMSDIEKIRKAENTINKELISNMYVSLNDFYDEIGLERTRGGDDLGWNIDNGLVEIDFSSHLTDEGKPCLVIDYSIAPRYDFTKLM